MIYDHQSRAARYGTIHPLLRTALEELSRIDPQSLTPGRRDLQGDRLFLLVNEYSTQPEEKIRFEAHRRYTDIQWMLEGEERIDVAPLERMTPLDPHDEARDIGFFNGTGDPISLRTGTFAIFFPHDAHRPGIALGSLIPVRKIVVKADLGEFS